MKKWLKITLYVILGITIVCVSLLGYGYYQAVGKFETNESEYPDYIGHLSSKNVDFTENFERCSPNRMPNGFFDSSRTNIFRGSKRSFVNLINANFKVKDTTQNGFLNLRFILNCKGEVGNMEINELNENFETTELIDEMVEQLVELTARKENWVADDTENHLDKYMYITFNIVNGDVVEILP